MAPSIGDAPAKPRIAGKAAAATPAGKPGVVILTAEFQFDHDTPKTNQYRQDDRPDGERPEIGTLYLTKKFMASVKGPNTRRLRVTVEAIG